jgi:hypothetical protein
MFTLQEQTKLAEGGYPLEWGTGITFTNGNAPLSTYKTLVNLSGTISVAALDMRSSNKRTAIVSAAANQGSTTIAVDNVIGFTSSTFQRTPVSQANPALIQIGTRVYKQTGYTIAAPGSYAGTITLDASTPLAGQDGAVGSIVVPAAHTMWLREANGTAGFENTIGLNLVGDKLIRFNGTNGNLEFVNLAPGFAPSPNLNINIASGSISGSGNAAFPIGNVSAANVAVGGRIPSGSAAIDLRTATVLTGGNALWLADGQQIAFDASGANTISWDVPNSRVKSTGALGLFNPSGNSLVTNFGLSLGAAVAGGSDVNIITPNGSNIGIIPQGNGVVKIGGGGVGTINVGTINGGGITVPLATTGLTPTFVQSVLLAGSVTGSGIYPWTHWAVSSDTASATQAIADLQIDHNFGGTGYSGGRIGMLVNFVPTGAISNGGIIEGIQASVALPAMGGTNLNTGAKGAAAGMNPYIIFNAGAANLAGASCIEADMAAKAGSSYQTMNAFFAVHTASHVVGASSSDVAFLASDQVGSAVTSTAFAQVGYRASQWPLKSTGAIVRAELGTSASSPSTTAYGDDYLLATFSKAAFRSNGITIDGSGITRIGTGFLTASAAGLAIDAKGVVGAFSSIATAGSSWPTDGLQYYATDAFDGVWSLTLSGGAVTGVAVYRAPVTTGSPSTVLTLTPDPLATLWGATGLTINVTWDSTRSGLSLNPTGKKLGFNGTAPIAQPAAPVTLADVIAIIRNYGLSA